MRDFIQIIKICSKLCIITSTIIHFLHYSFCTIIVLKKEIKVFVGCVLTQFSDLFFFKISVVQNWATPDHTRLKINAIIVKLFLSIYIFDSKNMLHSQLRAAVIKNSHYAFLCFYGVGEGRQCYLEVESQA